MPKSATVQKFSSSIRGVHAWALDFPASDKPAKVTEHGLYVQGWVLTEPGISRGPVMLRTGKGATENQRAITLNSGRPDVIQRLLGLPPEGHPQLRCGFVGYLAEVPDEFSLGVTLNGDVTWLCTVQLDEKEAAAAEPAKPQLIQGPEGWLFLDNDTNGSVDQYTGRLILDRAGIARWRTYLDGCRSLACGSGARHSVLIAASKEQVLPEHYPHKKAEVTILDQVMAICRPADHVVNTAAVLAMRFDRETCFMKTDTHWTDRGAMLATLALLQELGLDPEKARQRFDNDVYHTMPFAGDLGIKLTPALAAPTEFLCAPRVDTGATFDNCLPNIGRVLIFNEDEATWDHNLLIFGASSTYPMLKYLKRLFRRIVFVHSAGNVDAEIVRHERPSLLVMQTTARFMIEPPNTAFCLRDAVEIKLGNSSDEVRNRAIAAMPSPPLQEENLPYHRMLEILT
jgi:hypothetical protein